MNRWLGSLFILLLTLSIIMSCAANEVPPIPDPDTNALAAVWPEDGGYMDENRVENPFFAISISSSDTDGSGEYRFELYSDSDGVELIGYQSGIISQSNEPYVLWYPTVVNSSQSSNGIEETLESREPINNDIFALADGEVPLMDIGSTYYWRVKAFVKGVAYISAIYSFSFQNMCEIGGSTYAERVIRWDVRDECKALVTHTNTDDALGAPNAGGHSDDSTGHGYLSLGYGGSIVVEMGKTVYDWPGNDLLAWEYISIEWVEMYAGESPAGPWYYLGRRFCEDWCGWDLGYAGLKYARFFKVVDGWDANWECHETAGADIDSIQATGWADDSALCE
ncbi:MAG TPA: hypothetical protein QF720_00110 [Nitrospinota bacterium]|mgnify:CR=1 FL=1|nr:hypothetical protein [Nitrospinota bacterium]